MTIKQLEYFMEVARQLNFSKAAETLFISQPALSRSIVSLEEELGVRLFTRSKHDVTLTQAGFVLASEVPRLGADLSRIVVDVQQTDEGQRGKLRFALADGLPFLPPLRAAQDFFLKKLPFVNLMPVCLSTEELIGCLKSGSVDLVYTYDLQNELDPALCDLTLREEHYALAVAADSRYADAGHVSLKDIHREKFFMACTESSFELHRWKDICTRIGFMPLFITVLNLNTLALCVRSGYGVALMPESHTLFEDPQIRRVELDDRIPLRYMLKWDAINPNPCLKTFLDMTRSSLKKTAVPDGAAATTSSPQ